MGLMSKPALVFRVATRPTLGGPLRDHVVGVTRPDSALARDGWPEVEVLIGAQPGAEHASVHAGLAKRAGHDALAEGRRALAKAKKPARGRRPAPVVDFMVAGPPAFER